MSTATAESVATYDRVPLELLVESPLNPRKHLDEAKLVELVESIRQHDIIEPIVVRESPYDSQEPRYEIVAGHRRARAARLAALDTVPVMVRVLTDAQLLELALQENIHQASMSAVDEAEALAKLAELDPLYRDPKVLASKIGRSESYVRGRLKLLRLAPVVRDALQAEAITASHAERIARLPVDQHEAALGYCFNPLLIDMTVIEDLRGLDAHESAAATHGLDEYFLIAIGRWDLLAPTVKSVGAVDEWIQEHGRLDLSAPEVQQQLAPVVDEMLDQHGEPGDDDPDDLRQAALDELAATALQLSRDWMTRTQAQRTGVIAPDDWKAVDPKTRCAHARRGIVVHGGPLEVLDVCIERKKCEVHWPKPKKEATTKASKQAAEEDSWKERERRAKEERERWAAMQKEAFAAFVAHLAQADLSIEAVVRAVVASYDLQGVKKQFGVALTAETALQVLVLNSVHTWLFEQFAASTKTWGFDAKAWRKQYEKAQAAEGKAKLDAQREQLAGEKGAKDSKPTGSKSKGGKSTAKKGGRK